MIRILILGAGNMAAEHAKAFGGMDGVTLAGAVDTNPDNLAAFCKTFGIPKSFDNLDDAIAWGEFDAAANVTPDVVHHPTTMALIEAGKHVFCEKPLATSYPLAIEMTVAAESRGLVNMVNLTYRGSPAAGKAREIVQAGSLGNLRHFEASYMQSWLVGKQWGDWRTEDRWLWRLSTGHGSHGVVGDIGVHIIDLLTYVAAEDIARMQSRTRTFHKAEGDRIGEYVLDANDTFTMTAEMESGAVGVLHATRWATGHANDLRINLYGDRGALRIRTDGKKSSLVMCSGRDVDDQTWRDVECPPVPRMYDLFIAAVRAGGGAGPSFHDAAKTQKILDLCLEAGESGSGPVALF